MRQLPMSNTGTRGAGFACTGFDNARAGDRTVDPGDAFVLLLGGGADFVHEVYSLV